MNSYLIPILIKPIIENPTKNNTLYYNDKFIVIEDKVHTDKSFHYCAWARWDCKSLLEITPNDLVHIKEIIRKVKPLLKSEPIIFIHFSPNWWRLHIHFVEKNHEFKAHMNEVHIIDDVIQKLENNPKYYIENVLIKSSI